MATFTRMGAFPIGYFRAYSSWLLSHRRTIPSRVSTLSAEIERIGMVKVYYLALPDGTRTEGKLGFSVTQGSTLEKLLQAYIANGGNPLEISSFMYPQSTSVDADASGSTSASYQYPSGGVVAPQSGNPNDPLPSDTETGYGLSPAGIPNTHKYFPARQLGRVSPAAYAYDPLVKSMHRIRAWANQDIKERLSDLEARIIKQCDLREQLINERDITLVQAFGGVLAGIQDLDPERFDKNLMVQNLIQDLSETMYETNDNGIFAPKHRPDAYLPFTFPNVPADDGMYLGV